MLRLRTAAAGIAGAMLAAAAPTAMAGGAPWDNPARCAFVHHEIEATVDPATAGLQATDWVLLLHPADVPAARRAPFLLNRSLAIRSIEAFDHGRPFALRWNEEERWEPCDFWARPEYPELAGLDHARQIGLQPAPPALAWPESLLLVVTYRGTVYDSLRAPRAEYQRGFETTTGLIDPRGVFLNGGSLWYPRRFDPPCPFQLRARVPEGWMSVSQGRRVVGADSLGEASAPPPPDAPVLWDSPEPMDEIYLIAGPYRLHEEQHGDVAIETFTYGNDDEDLCRRYIAAARDYLDLYSGRIGPYPFAKFALVENFWQTGFGMPSFTLLGSTVIRLPWILSTSYGHEILHNWWGNSVFVAAEQGNWCEGLTTYGADYLYKERASAEEARDYRRTALQGYLDYVRSARDFPLTEFRERENAATEAIGYRKSMMVFHMLRRHVGDTTFWNGLAEFYRRFRFQAASWTDLLGVFTSLTGEDLRPFRDQWVARAGAPELTLQRADRVPRPDGGTDLSYSLAQTEPYYALEVPVRATFLDRAPETWTVKMDGATFAETRHYATPPRSLEIDPDFDLFRRLHRGEAPAAVSQLMGTDTLTVVVAAASPAPLLEAYRTAAASVSAAIPTAVRDDGGLTLADLRTGGAWVLGEPTWSARLRELLPRGVAIDAQGFTVGGQRYDRAGHTLVLALSHPGAPDEALGWMLSEDPASAVAVAKKLTHYGKYGYLVFAGSNKVAEGVWEVERSPLKVVWEEEK